MYLPIFLMYYFICLCVQIYSDKRRVNKTKKLFDISSRKWVHCTSIASSKTGVLYRSLLLSDKLIIHMKTRWQEYTHTHTHTHTFSSHWTLIIVTTILQWLLFSSVWLGAQKSNGKLVTSYGNTNTHLSPYLMIINLPLFGKDCNLPTLTLLKLMVISSVRIRICLFRTLWASSSTHSVRVVSQKYKHNP